MIHTNITKRWFFGFLALFLAVACNNKQARRPISVKTGNTFLKESAKKNKQLLNSEEALIDSIIKKDTLHTFVDSQHGFKFYYLQQNPEADYTAQFGDKVTYNYGVSDLYGNEIYTHFQNARYDYLVEKEELFSGLRSALKILKEGESGVFFFPSELAYGYRGDKDKIESNQPIVAKIEVFKIEKNENPPVEITQKPEKDSVQ
ncbi:gliding motility-associated peptidyl-prolyl isomerase GldI [Capnocytophaga sp.]|uniref:gliding motility-associated peptidyl-prolyl isomerase GldI n=1 Tax=Capnocytophaga sp. TaxID=44737 RepID=UPI0026DC3A78|nr:gliding motility-associated peptidyl-prolyl isomerase GldI [Capnocytophaga sp.]MDO5106193.1 gliding motility-associated peptidyl-prolyl isomerase GldI [Capnocytophaga sp.]